MTDMPLNAIASVIETVRSLYASAKIDCTEYGEPGFGDRRVYGLAITFDDKYVKPFQAKIFLFGPDMIWRLQYDGWCFPVENRDAGIITACLFAKFGFQADFILDSHFTPIALDHIEILAVVERKANDVTPVKFMEYRARKLGGTEHEVFGIQTPKTIEMISTHTTTWPRTANEEYETGMSDVDKAMGFDKTYGNAVPGVTCNDPEQIDAPDKPLSEALRKADSLARKFQDAEMATAVLNATVNVVVKAARAEQWARRWKLARRVALTLAGAIFVAMIGQWGGTFTTPFETFCGFALMLILSVLLYVLAHVVEAVNKLVSKE